MSEDQRERPESDEPETSDAEGTEGPSVRGRERAEDVANKLKEEGDAAE